VDGLKGSPPLRRSLFSLTKKLEKKISKENALAYFAPPTVTHKKGFITSITLTPEAFII
jgi:hypothetical protein